MKSKVVFITAILLSFSILFYSCSSASKTEKGAIIGTAAGGVIGGVIGHEAGNTALGAILGAAVGGTAGALIGHYMDKQAEEMKKDLKDAKIERVGEGIKITFDSGILFQTDSYKLEKQAKDNINNLSVILNKYNDTNILVTGYTDSVGPEDYNKKLSSERASSVADYAKTRGVAGSRFSVVGFGENNPVASNQTADGKRKNRRVEIAIFANDKLKEAAKNGTLNR